MVYLIGIRCHFSYFYVFLTKINVILYIIKKDKFIYADVLIYRLLDWYGHWFWIFIVDPLKYTQNILKFGSKIDPKIIICVNS